MFHDKYKLNDFFVYEIIGDKVLVMNPTDSEVLEFSGAYADLISVFIKQNFTHDVFDSDLKLVFEDLVNLNVLHEVHEVSVSRRILLQGVSASAISAITMLSMPTAAMGASTGGGGGGGDSTPPPDPEITMAASPLETSIVVDGTDPGA